MLVVRFRFRFFRDKDSSTPQTIFTRQYSHSTRTGLSVQYLSKRREDDAVYTVLVHRMYCTRSYLPGMVYMEVNGYRGYLFW